MNSEDPTYIAEASKMPMANARSKAVETEGSNFLSVDSSNKFMRIKRMFKKQNSQLTCIYGFTWISKFLVGFWDVFSHKWCCNTKKRDVQNLWDDVEYWYGYSCRRQLVSTYVHDQKWKNKEDDKNANIKSVLKKEIKMQIAYPIYQWKLFPSVVLKAQ